MTIDFTDEYGVLSLNALSNADDEDRATLLQETERDWISNSAAILPNVSVEPPARKPSNQASKQKSIRGILGKLSCK